MFPHAGGAASTYSHWFDLANGDVEIRSVQYPGRETRLRELPPHSVGELADGLARAIAADEPGPDVVFFGHSMGGLVAFEVARRLRDLGQPSPRQLFVAACAAPGIRRIEGVSKLSDEELIDWLIHEDEAAAEALAHPELAALVLPPVRADLAAVETYEVVPGRPLDCPITVLTGADDTVQGPGISGWREHTTGEFGHHEFPGGHFFVRPAAGEIFTFMWDRLASGAP